MYLPCLCFRELQDRKMTFQVHAREEAIPLFLKVYQVLKQNQEHSGNTTYLFTYSTVESLIPLFFLENGK